MEPHHYHSTVAAQYQVVEYIKGHYVKNKDSIVEKNPIWVVNHNGKELLLMFVEPNILCRLCRESYQKILDFEKKHKNGAKFSWTKKDEKQKYIRTNFNNTTIYIHQVIMDWYGHGSGTTELSVDHIDREPLNNTLVNLRIATCKEQHDNSKGIVPNTKRERRNDAKELPENITQEELPKYITYNTNKYGKNNEFTREFFRIESHPLLISSQSTWSSTTKKSVSLQEKLQQAKDALEYLNSHDTLPEKVERDLPQYVSYYIEREKHLLVWQKNIGEQRLSKKITLENDYYELNKEDQENELNRLNREVIKKYENQYSIFTLDEDVLNEIQKEKEQELPMYVRTQTFYDGTYLIFNKSKGEYRVSLTQKLPPNHNINKELHLFNSKIVEKHGIEHAIVLDNYPYSATDDIVDIPEGIYVSMNCKKPYIFLMKDNDTYTLTLPERYNLQEQIELAQLLPDIQLKDQEHSIDEYKQLFTDGMKPNNISICLKDKRYYQIQYKLKTKEHRHDKAISLQRTPTLNMNLELVKMNEHIINIYGKQFAILLCK